MPVPTTMFLTQMRDAILAALNVEFSDLAGAVFADYKLDEEDGAEGLAIGVSPLDWAEVQGRANEIEARMLVQIYDLWQQEREGRVEPKFVELLCYRATTAIKAHEHDVGWFSRIRSVSFPADPAGDQTRAELIVTLRTDNPFGF